MGTKRSEGQAFIVDCNLLRQPVQEGAFLFVCGACSFDLRFEQGRLGTQTGCLCLGGKDRFEPHAEPGVLVG